MKPTKPQPTKSTAEIVRAGKETEFWKLISSYLANELADLSYDIIKKEYKGKQLTDAEVDQLRKNLDFVEWHINLPETILSSIEAKAEELPDYDHIYPSVGDTEREED